MVDDNGVNDMSKEQAGWTPGSGGFFANRLHSASVENIDAGDVIRVNIERCGSVNDSSRYDAVIRISGISEGRLKVSHVGDELAVSIHGLSEVNGLLHGLYHAAGLDIGKIFEKPHATKVCEGRIIEYEVVTRSNASIKKQAD